MPSGMGRQVTGNTGPLQRGVEAVLTIVVDAYRFAVFMDEPRARGFVPVPHIGENATVNGHWAVPTGVGFDAARNDPCVGVYLETRQRHQLTYSHARVQQYHHRAGPDVAGGRQLLDLVDLEVSECFLLGLAGRRELDGPGVI